MQKKRLGVSWLLALGVLFIGFLSWYWFGAMAYQTDTPSYINATLLWAGDSNIPDRLFRLSKPLSLLIPLLLYHFLGLSVVIGLYLQQYLAYAASSYLVYQILKKQLPKQAAYGVLAYLLCQPMAVYGLALLTDGLGWCLLLLGIYGCQQLFDSSKSSLWLAFFLGCYLGLACFVKESIVMAGIFTAWWILFSKHYTFSRKIALYSSIALGGILVLGIGNWLTYIYWDCSLIQWIQFGQDSPPAFSWKGFVAQAYHCIDAYWWLFGLGCWAAWQQRDKFPPTFWAYAATAASGWILLPLTWPYLYDRILFMLVPVMLPFIALGIGRLGAWAWFLLLSCGISQLWMTHCIYFYQQQGWIVWHGLFFMGIFLVFLGLEHLSTKHKNHLP